MTSSQIFSGDNDNMYYWLSLIVYIKGNILIYRDRLAVTVRQRPNCGGMDKYYVEEVLVLPNFTATVPVLQETATQQDPVCEEVVELAGSMEDTVSK
jgi:hypothetical protein